MKWEGGFLDTQNENDYFLQNDIVTALQKHLAVRDSLAYDALLE